MTKNLEKTVAIMQPYFFPYLGYWQLINLVDTFVVLDNVNYINKGFINRNIILLGNRPHRITLELKKASQNKHINEISIGHNAERLLRTISLAYKKARFFDSVYPLVADTLCQSTDNLSSFLVNSIKAVCRYLGITTNFVCASSLAEQDHLKGQEKILSICKQSKAGEYINLPGGKTLYDRNKFEQQDIRLRFLQPELPAYRQFDDGFVAGLSIIDIMMFNSLDDIRQMLNKYTLE